jgi:hypothetical protein
MALHANSSAFAPAIFELLLTDLAIDAIVPFIELTEDSIVRFAQYLPLSSCDRLYNLACLSM